MLAQADARWRCCAPARPVRCASTARRVPPRSATEYFQQNCHIGVSLPRPADIAAAVGPVGLDRVMWGNDYPHDEGTYPFTREHLRQVAGHLEPEQLQQFLAGNAAEVYGFDLDALAPGRRSVRPDGGGARRAAHRAARRARTSRCAARRRSCPGPVRPLTLSADFWTSERVRRERVASRRVAAAVAHGEPPLTLAGGSVGPRLAVDLPTHPLLDPVVADRGSGIETPGDVVIRQLRDEAGLEGMSSPHAGVAVGLELEPDRPRLRPCAVVPDRAPRCRAGAARDGRTRGRRRTPPRTARLARRSASASSSKKPRSMYTCWSRGSRRARPPRSRSRSRWPPRRRTAPSRRGVVAHRGGPVLLHRVHDRDERAVSATGSRRRPSRTPRLPTRPPRRGGPHPILLHRRRPGPRTGSSARTMRPTSPPPPPIAIPGPPSPLGMPIPRRSKTWPVRSFAPIGIAWPVPTHARVGDASVVDDRGAGGPRRRGAAAHRRPGSPRTALGRVPARR